MEKNYRSVHTLDTISAQVSASHNYKIFIATVTPKPVMENKDCAEIMENIVMPYIA
jgi:hypothetical protein